MQENTPQSSKKSNSKGLLIALVILLIIVIAGGAIWLYIVYSKVADVEDELAITDELPKIEETLPEPKADETVTVDEPADEPIEEPDEPEEPAEPKEIDYYNRKYGFGFTFPATWEDYLVTEEDTKWDDFTATSLYFGFDAQEGLFAVSVFTKAQWDKIKDLPPEQRQVSYLGENSQYVFAWSRTQYFANEEIEKLFKDVPDIIKSFSIMQ